MLFSPSDASRLVMNLRILLSKIGLIVAEYYGCFEHLARTN